MIGSAFAQAATAGAPVETFDWKALLMGLGLILSYVLHLRTHLATRNNRKADASREAFQANYAEQLRDWLVKLQELSATIEAVWRSNLPADQIQAKTVEHSKTFGEYLSNIESILSTMDMASEVPGTDWLAVHEAAIWDAHNGLNKALAVHNTAVVQQQGITQFVQGIRATLAADRAKLAVTESGF